MLAFLVTLAFFYGSMWFHRKLGEFFPVWLAGSSLFVDGLITFDKTFFYLANGWRVEWRQNLLLIRYHLTCVFLPESDFHFSGGLQVASQDKNLDVQITNYTLIKA